MKEEEHRNWRIICCLALEFLTRRREKVNRMWCETRSRRVSEMDFLDAGTTRTTTKHRPDRRHTAQAQWPFVWHALGVQKLSEQVARHLETLVEGPELSNSSHTTLPGEKEGYLQWNLDVWQPQVLFIQGLLRNKCSLVSFYVNTMTLR